MRHAQSCLAMAQTPRQRALVPAPLNMTTEDTDSARCQVARENATASDETSANQSENKPRLVKSHDRNPRSLPLVLANLIRLVRRVLGASAMNSSKSISALPSASARAKIPSIAASPR